MQDFIIKFTFGRAFRFRRLFFVSFLLFVFWMFFLKSFSFALCHFSWKIKNKNVFCWRTSFRLLFFRVMLACKLEMESNPNENIFDEFYNDANQKMKKCVHFLFARRCGTDKAQKNAWEILWQLFNILTRKLVPSTICANTEKSLFLMNSTVM